MRSDRKFTRKKFVAFITAACMTLTMLPALAFAQEVAAPETPVVSVGKVSTTSAALSWEPCPSATGYDVYIGKSKNGDFVLDAELDADATSFTVKDLTPGQAYYFYVIAKNVTDEGTGQQTSATVSATTPKAATKVTGAITKASKKARTVLKDKVTIRAPFGRTLKLQTAREGKWTTVKSIKLAGGLSDQTLTITYPNSWWKENKTTWRYTIAANKNAKKYTSKTIRLATKKYYQNPKKYVQLKNTISKHGHNYYTAPVLTNNQSTRKQHVEAMIKTAKKYLGDPYVVCQSRAPGKGVDCSGLVMQACYGAGADLWPSNPYRHRFPKYEYESRRIAKNPKLKTVSWKNRKRGDLIFYSKSGIVIHVGIYLGKGKIIHSWPGYVRISSATNPRWGYVSKVKRVFL